MLRYGLLLLLVCLSLGARAQDGIHRCVGPEGTPLFTDQPCAALQATPVTPPRDEPPATLTAPTTAATPPPVLCAATVSELRQSVLDAFSARDPNRLAGLMLWGGYGRESVVADIRSLGGLMQRPLLGIGDDSTGDDESPATTASSAAVPPTSAGEERQLVVRTAAGDGSGQAHETRFDVVRRSGCLWLRGRG
ncbi:DUF4124 domain-containing protein [Dyella jiangningensis]|uniref:DUF4124 domain-containing protein n=1 Tax=Dyella jiangningensis TaxID=1379159 RepID=A0A328P8H6_9GAMM|nr:DUF4124 domain-containing protein [Dyella jiangningensis]RAO76895.1 hypothetical protein CA260_02990 [Dyella jiangningensis]